MGVSSNSDALTIEHLIESFRSDPKIGDFDEAAVRERYAVLCESDKIEKAHGKPGWMRQPWKLLYWELLEASSQKSQCTTIDSDKVV